MTRRSLFASIAAAIAGQKLIPVPPSRWSNAVGPPLSPQPLREAIQDLSNVRRYYYAQYGVGFTIRLDISEADLRLLQFIPGKLSPLPDYLVDPAEWRGLWETRVPPAGDRLSIFQKD